MRERSKLPMLLTELTFALLIFAFCAAVCLSVFAASRRTAEESDRLGNAVSWAQSAAEAYRAAKGDMAETASLLGMTVSGDAAGYTCCFDENWQPVSCAQSSFVLNMRETDENSASIEVTGSDGLIFALDVKAVAYG